jgi:ribosomal protein S8
MQFDPLNDAFTRIFNAENAGHYEVTVSPASKLLGSMLSIMQKSGYVGEYEKLDDGRGGGFRVELIGAINRCGVITILTCTRFRASHPNHQSRCNEPLRSEKGENWRTFARLYFLRGDEVCQS